jgi:hypothetical protein
LVVADEEQIAKLEKWIRVAHYRRREKEGL